MERATRKVTYLGSMATFASGRACSDALYSILNRAFQQEADAKERSPEERAAVTFAGGLLQQGYQCGMIWGAVLAAGARAYQVHPTPSQAETAAIHSAQRIVESFRSDNGCIDCADLTQPDLKSSSQIIKYFLLKGGVVGCFRRAGRFGPIAFAEITSSLSRPVESVSGGLTGCASILMQRMGASEEHAVMASGLSGGIGLCGGGCGALGAAIWMLAMDAVGRGEDAWGSAAFRARADAAIAGFLKSSGYEFECSAITGRRFSDPAEHAEFVRKGGCAGILEALASCRSAS